MLDWASSYTPAQTQLECISFMRGITFLDVPPKLPSLFPFLTLLHLSLFSWTSAALMPRGMFGSTFPAALGMTFPGGVNHTFEDSAAATDSVKTKSKPEKLRYY